MLILLVITFDRKIALIHNLRHWKLDFKSFLMVYYMSNSDNPTRIDDRLNLLRFFSTKRRLGFCGRKVTADSAVGSGKVIVLLH